MVAQPSYDPASMLPPAGVVVRLNATIADLAQLPDDGFRYALVGGVLLKMPPPKRLHGMICVRLIAWLLEYCKAHSMENQLIADAGFDFTPSEAKPTILAPDISFTQAIAVPQPGAPYDQAPPLLAVEVVSPSETRAYMEDKVAIFRRGGVQVVWVIWPDLRTVDVWDATGMQTLTETETLTGGTLLPGFAVPVRDIFPE